MMRFVALPVVVVSLVVVVVISSAAASYIEPLLTLA